MKTKLEGANRDIKKLELEKKEKEEKMRNMEIDTKEMHNRHDEMFEQTSSLNARIEELESHKLLLLEKLKQLGDKSGLEYIIKTQKLDNVKGKQVPRVDLDEDYEPESSRAARDEAFK